MAESTWLYMRPDEVLVLPGDSVLMSPSVVTGLTDTTYEPSWLCDWRFGRPVRGPAGGALSLSITALASLLCNGAVLCNHNLDDDVDLVLSGDVSATLTGNGDQADGIPLNRWKQFAAVTATSVDVDVTGNTDDVMIGELAIGNFRTLARALGEGTTFDVPASDKVDPDTVFPSVNAYDPGLAREGPPVGVQWFEVTELEEILQWYKSTRAGALPTIIVPFPDDLDSHAYVVLMSPPQVSRREGKAMVGLSFTEVPREDWAA